MKKIIIVLFALFCTFFAYSQKIAENKTDEFTKNKIIRTDWEKILATSKIYLNVRINKINDSYFLELKFFPHGVSSIDTKDDISFMFENGEILNLHSDEYRLSNYGDGSIGIIGSQALGLNVDCPLTQSDLEKFKTNIVVKIRINKSEGYSEDILKIKNSQKFRDMFLLIDSKL